MADTLTPKPSNRCPVCKSPHKAQIHALIASGMPMVHISAQTRTMGTAIKRETLMRHFKACLGGVKPVIDAQDIADAGKAAQTQAEVDFAILVQKRATALLAAGELRVTATHGLQAQALLDRRLEKQADRDLALNMARLLSGAMVMAPQMVIEGRVVSPPELEDGLAPEGVYERIG